MSESNRAPGAPYRRIVLKLSGESFAPPGERGISMEEVVHIAAQTYRAMQQGVQIAIVIGGGNILRGAQFTAGNSSIQEATAHYMGMLATVINGLALQDALERVGQQCRVMTAVEMPKVAEPYIRRRAQRHMEKGRVVIFAGGTGNPFFTTDTAAALRAAEIEAQAILKGTHSGVDGVYTADPKLDPTATRFEEISYLDVIAKNLRVMDATAIAFCRDNDIPIVVFDVSTPGNVRCVLEGQRVGTLVT
jgi:uridylate kinase